MLVRFIVCCFLVLDRLVDWLLIKPLACLAIGLHRVLSWALYDPLLEAANRAVERQIVLEHKRKRYWRMYRLDRWKLVVWPIPATARAEGQSAVHKEKLLAELRAWRRAERDF